MRCLRGLRSLRQLRAKLLPAYSVTLRASRRGHRAGTRAHSASSGVGRDGSIGRRAYSHGHRDGWIGLRPYSRGHLDGWIGRRAYSSVQLCPNIGHRSYSRARTDGPGFQFWDTFPRPSCFCFRSGPSGRSARAEFAQVNGKDCLPHRPGARGNRRVSQSETLGGHSGRPYARASTPSVQVDGHFVQFWDTGGRGRRRRSRAGEKFVPLREKTGFGAGAGEETHWASRQLDAVRCDRVAISPCLRSRRQGMASRVAPPSTGWVHPAVGDGSGWHDWPKTSFAAGSRQGYCREITPHRNMR